MLMMVLLGIAAHFQWVPAAFDVEAAFLTGLGMKHEMLCVDSHIANIMMNLDAEAEIDLNKGIRTPWRL